MAAELVIDWAEAARIGAPDWYDTFIQVVANERRLNALKLRSDGEAVDILFVTYMAAEHERVVKERLVEQILARSGTYIGTDVHVVACDRSEPVLLEPAVQELAVSQTVLTPRRAWGFRAITALELEDVATRSIAGAIQRRALSRPFVPLPSDETYVSFIREDDL